MDDRRNDVIDSDSRPPLGCGPAPHPGMGRYSGPRNFESTLSEEHARSRDQQYGYEFRRRDLPPTNASLLRPASIAHAVSHSRHEQRREGQFTTARMNPS